MKTKELISLSKSIIIACDTDLLLYKKILKETGDIPGISAYKVGIDLALRYGLPEVVSIAKDITEKPIIYDHQKACTDIPEMGHKFVKVCKEAGLDAIIYFPLSGAQTEKEWIEAARDENMKVLLGGYMSHLQFLVSEGGYIQDDRVIDLYNLAYTMGIRDFIIPSTKLHLFYNLPFAQKDTKINYYLTGLILQGGKIKEVDTLLKERYHCIIGRAIYGSDNIIREISLKLLEELHC